ncbi:MAG: ABC transporter permease [Trueperaceae bacterium]|nr:ABC transporter permease [Trueperaceae bacterium]
MTKVLAIGINNLKRFLRDRSNYFFALLLPIGLIFITGVTFGAQTRARIAVHGDGRLVERFAAALDGREGLEVVRVPDEAGLREGVERGGYVVGVAFPTGLDDLVAGGASAEVAYYGQAGGTGQNYRLDVQAALESATADALAAGHLARRTGEPFAEALGAVREAAARVPELSLDTVIVDAGGARRNYLGFGLVSAAELVLFVFLTGLTSATNLVESRKLGVTRRMLASPTGSLTIVVGEGLGRFLVALFQGMYVVVASNLVFGVEWGAPLAVLVLLGAFSAVAAGAGMLIGSVFSSAQQAGGVSVMLGLVLAALGGCMVPLELFGRTMREVAKVVPHSWALEGFNVLVRQEGGLGAVLPYVGVLLGFAVVLFALAGWRLRAAITQA